MATHDDEAELLPPRAVLAATGMPRASYETLRHRGQLGSAFFGVADSGRRLFTRRGFLALALYRAMTARRLEVVELDPNSCIRWADLWLRTRDTAKPIRELWIRYYDRPGEPDAKVSLAPNADVLTGAPPAPDATMTIIFDLNQIFGRAERELREGPAASRDPVEVFSLPENTDA